MTPARMNRSIALQVDQLHRLGLLDDRAHARIADRYCRGRWHWHALSRWFLIFGAVSVLIGVSIGLRSLFDFTLEKLAFVLALASVAAFVGARLLEARKPQLVWSRQSIELLGGFLLIGLTFTLGAIFDTGTGNWPALVAIDLALLAALSYVLANRLLLILSAVVFFVWFGGFTGYSSGWNVYWFGMGYPLRFLFAATAIAAMGVLHLHLEEHRQSRYRGFGKIWLSAGLFFAEMSLWLLSLFGNFNLDDGWSRPDSGELVLFNVIWLVGNVGLMLFGIRYLMRMLTAYGATFLIIQIYTLFFAHVAEDLGTFLSLFISGGSALALAFWLEHRRRRGRPGSNATHERDRHKAQPLAGT